MVGGYTAHHETRDRTQFDVAQAVTTSAVVGRERRQMQERQCAAQHARTVQVRVGGDNKERAPLACVCARGSVSRR